jgi:PAS domain S-box-containing protein
VAGRYTLALALFTLVSVLITWLNVSRQRINTERVALLVRERAARREAEAERVRLRTLFQDAPAHIALFQGPQHLFVLSNALCSELLAGRELLGKPLRQAVPEAEAMGLAARLDELYRTGKPLSLRAASVRLSQPDGTARELFFNLICQPTFDGEGRREGVAAFGFDVTESVRARQRAEEAEQRLHRLADSIPAIVWSAGTDGVNDYYNQPWYDYTGIPRGSLDFELATRACHPEDLAAQWSRWQECMARGEPFQGEYRIRRASDQSWRWHLTRTVPWKDESGRVARWFGTSIDIDQQKRAETALRESEARFRNMADHAPVMLWMTDAANQYTYFSRPWYEFTGRTEAESLGRQWLQAVYPEDVPPLRQLALTAISRHEPFRVDYRLRRADGEFRWVNGSAVPRFGNSGELLGYIGSIIDITARKRSETLLSLLASTGAILGTSLDEEETLAAIARLTVPAFADWCLVDLQQADGTFRRVRVAHAAPGDAELACQIQRFSLMPASGTLHPPSQALLRRETVLIEHFTPERLSQSGYTGQHAQVLRGGGLLSGIAVPLVARGSMLGVLSFYTSRSGRHFTVEDQPIAEELARRTALSVDNARLYQSAQEAVRLRDEFLSVASHELKTPLTPLSLKLQVLAQKAAAQPDSPFKREVLAHVEVGHKQVRKLGALIGDLLDVSRISAGRVRLDWEPVDFAALVREVVSRHEAQAQQTGTPLRVEAPASLMGTWDAIRLEQVVLNLLDNALKYGPGKPVVLRLEEEGGNAVLTVKDEGIGIAPEAQRHIFDQFVRAVSDRHYGGLGLGLYIAKSYVEAMRGTIHVRSEPGQGATFTVVLPRRAPI